MAEENFICCYNYSKNGITQFFIFSSPNSRNPNAFLFSRERIKCSADFKTCVQADALSELENDDILLSLRSLYGILTKREQFNMHYPGDSMLANILTERTTSKNHSHYKNDHSGQL